jgi:hypothetical protein
MFTFFECTETLPQLVQCKPNELHAVVPVESKGRPGVIDCVDHPKITNIQVENMSDHLHKCVYEESALKLLSAIAVDSCLTVEPQ